MSENKLKDKGDISELNLTTQIENTIEDFDRQKQRIDSCMGVCLGEENRLVTNERVYYDLSYQKQTVHQFILAREIRNNQKETKNNSINFFQRIIRNLKAR